MHKMIALVPMALFLPLATITESTEITLGLFIAGVLFSVALTFRVGRWFQKVMDKMESLERRLDHLEKPK